VAASSGSGVDVSKGEGVTVGNGVGVGVGVSVTTNAGVGVGVLNWATMMVDVAVGAGPRRSVPAPPQAGNTIKISKTIIRFIGFTISRN
jgi:hypothetical protein